MANDIGAAFAVTACKLLSEYTARLATQKQDVIRILEQFHNAPPNKKDMGLLHARYRNEFDDFMQSKEVFNTLIRKASQWVEHGRLSQPHLEMELEVRLADLESKLRSMERFFHSNQI